MGAIEGAAARYGEQVHVVEQTCMRRGDPVCLFEIRFFASSTASPETPEQIERQQVKQQFAQFILSLLPDNGGVTLVELQKMLSLRGLNKEWVRPAGGVMASP
jgi:hypothetical protein